ncbi:MAG: hypothetical protein Q8N31_27695 [Reyranella sp.]|nr:hypothetical protein [Reyranella sp.]MDP3163815.1 hypothetical protein [Reyranella sp.]
MNEPNESGAPIYVFPEIHFTPDGQHSVEPSEETAPPAAAPPAQATPQEPLPEESLPAELGPSGPVIEERPAPAEPPAQEPPAEEAAAEEPPMERHDPFAYMRKAPWMDRRLSASGRAAALLRRDLKAFPVIEGRDPNHADLDAIVKRTVDYIVPIIKREQLTDYAYDVLEEKRQARIAKRRSAANEIDRAAQGFIRVSGGSLDQQQDDKPTSADVGLPAEVGPSLAQLGSVALDERIRSQKWSDRSDDREYLKSLEKFAGHAVRLPDGSKVPDPYSPTEYLMSPVDNLRRVAAAGRAAGRNGLSGLAATFAPGGAIPSLTIFEQVYEQTRAAIAQGGEFDYQRKAAAGEKSGFVQLRQFWNVSNFNVGLFMQQAGFRLEATLWVAGKYAWLNSSNYSPNEPDGLHPRTRQFIVLGHKAGASGAFD